MKIIPPKVGNSCFGCGADNPQGLKLSFEGDPEQDRVWVEFQPSPFMAGGIGMMHGGFIALLLDCLLYTSPSPRDQRGSRMPSSA